MIRGLFRLVYRLLTVAILVVLGTAIWIVYDGLNDQGDHADVAVVPGGAVRHDGVPAPVLRARLERASELYKEKKFPLIIVSGATELEGHDEAAAMSNFLVEQQVPITAIIQDKGGAHTSDTAWDVARIMHARHLHSAMIVSQYYHITRLKLALKHAGIHDIEQAHVGVVEPSDAWVLGREVLALYDYMFKFYLLPDSEEARRDLRTDGDKIRDAADKERDRLREKAESLHK